LPRHEGKVGAGDEITLVARDPNVVPISEITRLYVAKKIQRWGRGFRTARLPSSGFAGKLEGILSRAAWKGEWLNAAALRLKVSLRSGAGRSSLLARWAHNTKVGATMLRRQGGRSTPGRGWLWGGFCYRLL